MPSRSRAATSLLTTALMLATASPALAAPSYRTICERVAGMVDDERAISFTEVRGLDIVNVAWEDTGRYYGSSVGPNISDVTIQVQRTYGKRQRVQTYLMPVIRYPNFADKSGDVPMERIQLLVGNERGEELRPVNLRHFLGNIREYLHDPGSWPGETTSLLADNRDSHVLVSAQGAYLPIPKGGTATFNPVIFNYQSGRKNPAVLTILATREGTSVTIIDNARDGFDADGAWGQRLFFNASGQKASLTGTRESDFVAAGGDPTPGTPLPSAGEEQGLNMVMLIQVPLKHRSFRRKTMAVAKMAAGVGTGGGGEERWESDVENAVIGHGALEGPFVEMDDLPIERDPRFPVRVTVQFYKATSNGVISRTDVKNIQAQIKRVYKDADYVGSLVTQGYTGRPTEWFGDHTEPPGWWRDFWDHYQEQSGYDSATLWNVVRWRYFPHFVAGHGGPERPRVQ